MVGCDVMDQTPLLAPDSAGGVGRTEPVGRRAPTGGDGCLHHRFEARAAQCPNAIALSFGTERLSYGELNRRATLLAARLRVMGVGPERLVGLSATRRIETIVGMLAILKAGGAYLPLEPAYPVARLARILDDARPAQLLACHDEAAAWAGFNVPVMEIDGPDADRSDVAAAGGGIQPRAEVGPGNLAYVIYTSGSTGTPKGVQVSHFNVVRLLAASDACFDFTASDVWTLFHSCAFDFSVWEVWGAFAHGGRLVIVPQDTTRAPDAFLRLLIDSRVTVLNQTPTAFGTLVRAIERANVTTWTSLRYVIFGGEALDTPILRPWYRRFDEARPRLVNMYGITETTVHVTYRPLRAADVERGGSPIGRPLPDLRVHVLDADGQPSAVGEPGELYVGGAGVARGYLNRPDLDGERFVPDPFDPAGRHRLYRSGDLVCWGEDGELEYVGRVDDQIKLRGFRIEPAEIEDVVRQSEGVAQCVAVLREDHPGEPRIVAYVVPVDAASAPSPRDLRRVAAARLPEHMIPSAWVVLAELPRTVSGKVDRAGLPAPDATGVASRPYAPPTTDVERQVAAVWAAVLGVDRVGGDDVFLELGGHSLSAVQVVNRLRATLGVGVPICRLLGECSVAQLAAEIEAARTRGGDGQATATSFGSAPALVADASPDEPLSGFTYRATSAQEQVGFFHALSPGNRAYVTQSVFRFEGGLDRSGLRRAIQTIVDRHEHLRTTYEVGLDGRLVGTVHSALDVGLPCRDLRDVPESGRGQTLEREIAAILEDGIDPSRLPLAKWFLFRIGDARDDLVMIEHHYVHDGWSFRLFIRELSEIYTALVDGQSWRAPAPTQFRQYAAWQRQWLDSRSAAGLAVEWAARLRDCEPTLELPLARPRHQAPSLRGGQLRVNVPDRLARAVAERAATWRVTLFQLMFGAFAVLVRRLTERDDFLLGTSSANRTRIEWESLVGMLVNIVPVRVRSDALMSVRTFMAEVAESLRWSLDRADLPFASIVEAVNPVRTAEAIPLVQVHFSSHNSLGTDLRFGSLRWSVLEAVGNGTAKFDLGVITIPQPRRGGIDLLFEYSADRFGQAEVSRIAGDYQRLLAAIAADPDADIARLPMMDPAERHRVVTGWNQTARPFPEDEGLAELFERQVRRNPAAPAVCAGERPLTYGALDSRANRLSHWLRARGVGPDVPVALCLPRSPEAIVAILGIVKAGGAYVPLDPDEPPERLAFALRDSGAALVIGRRSTLDALSACGPTRVDLDELAAASAGRPDSPPAPASRGDHLAYIVYTSGSAGRRKGVAAPQRAVSRLVLNTDYVTLDETSVVAHAANLAFDAATFEVWGPLLNGGCLAILEKDQLLSPAAFRDALRRYRIDTMFLTTAVFNEHAARSPGLFASLGTLLVGGEAADPRAVSRVLAAGPPRRLSNIYGPTEATTFALCYEVPADGDELACVPIGRPIANTRAYMLDACGEPVAPGLTGELCLGGPGLARGYVNLPDLTAERFVADPFVAGDRIFRTGDRVRLRPDGNIEFLSRFDRQVKLRGFRIELGEIETMFGSLEGVEQCAVVVREPAGEGPRLVAYYCGPADDAPGLRRQLKRLLPEYMVPAAVVRLAALPLNANGKVDRAALPEPWTDRAGDPPQEAAADEGTERMRSIWARVLGRAAVGLHEDFFDLGGHSLLALRLLGEIERELGRTLRLAALFEAPTVAELQFGSYGIQGARLRRRARSPSSAKAARAAVLRVRLGRRHPGLQEPGA